MTDPPGRSGGRPRRGLGRGLDALLGGGLPAAVLGPEGEPEATLVEVDPAAVAPNPEQPRQAFDEASLEALARSIELHGMLQPVVVERDGRGFRLVAGERRLRAARRAGLSTIPAVVRPSSESARHALELALIENLHRTDLTALEEAAAYARLADAFGLSHEAIGLRVGRSRAAVSNTMRLLSLAPEVQAAVAEGRLSAGHARALLSVQDAARQEALAADVEERHLTVRQTEELVAAALAPRAATGEQSAAPGSRATAAGALARGADADDRALEQGLEEALGAPVRLQRRRRGGRLVIEFFSDTELDALYSRLGGAPL